MALLARSLFRLTARCPSSPAGDFEHRFLDFGLGEIFDFQLNVRDVGRFIAGTTQSAMAGPSVSSVILSLSQFVAH